jgi:hypothetical protein
MSRRQSRKAVSPVPPTNVCLVLPGRPEPIPLDCVYQGINGEGCHQWEAIVPLTAPPRDGFQVLVDVLPPRTAIDVRFLINRNPR